MSALKKLWRWLRLRTRLPEPGPDGNDLQLSDKPFLAPDFNGGQLHNDVEKQLKLANNQARSQQNWHSRAGPWQQK